MSYGLPVISSSATCLPEVLEDAAKYFNPRSTTSIAKVISAVVSDKDLQASMVKKGYTQVKKYNWKKTAKQTLNTYEKVLRNS